VLAVKLLSSLEELMTEAGTLCSFPNSTFSFEGNVYDQIYTIFYEVLRFIIFSAQVT